MKIVEKPKNKKNKTKSYYHWLAEPPPRRKKRLPQLNKHNRMAKARLKKSQAIDLIDVA